MSTSSDVSTQITRLAADLEKAEQERLPIAPPSAQWAGLDLDSAYRIQRVNIARRLDRGEHIVGHKIGLTSLAMQQQLGIDSPDYGAITDAMVIVDGATFDTSELISARVEPEFAFRIGTDLPVSPSLDELTAAIDGVCVALEVIDSRVADWKITLVDTVADNASSARVVWGEMAPATPELLAALPGLVISLRRDGQEIASGPGSAVLGDPLASVRWLAGVIGSFGERFRAGDFILAGAVSAAAPFDAGVQWSASADGLRPVSVTTSPIGKEHVE
ncbi:MULTISPECIES: 2-keto-4-pentenoate hydratase [Microbacterium]|uniref:2-keto-4-pentenoate hydratase n=1 Tax=Microbacterium saccharophilum TaxID=1213358 RepID=A0A7Z7D394_9MICO|nr:MULTISPECIES: fumarylacetoacetate hydrolase family protein [Microbacterium]SFI78134.1 2-keto-4-pentenoate hydratase [Microbacterium saccharophilum]